MKRSLLVALTIPLLILSLSTNAQGLKSFSQDPGEFIAQVAGLYGGVTNSKVRAEIESVLGEFFTAWDSSYFSDDEKTMVIEDANILLKRRLADRLRGSMKAQRKRRCSGIPLAL